MENSQENLISRSQAGHTEAFGELVKMHAGRAVAAAYGMLGCHDEALDASQDAFVRAWRGIGRFSGRANFYTWYYSILRNLCVDRLRSRRKHKCAELNYDHAACPSQSDPAVLAVNNEQSQHIWKAILELQLIHREIIVMSHFQEMSYKEMAEVLEVPIGTVMSRLHNARKNLGDKLAEKKHEL